jgi:hypothetical protein
MVGIRHVGEGNDIGGRQRRFDIDDAIFAFLNRSDRIQGLNLPGDRQTAQQGKK